MNGFVLVPFPKYLNWYRDRAVMAPLEEYRYGPGYFF
jgi:hypothetical protein